MAATKDEIASWFDRGVDYGNMWMVVMLDESDDEDYPSYHVTEESARTAAREPGSMTRAMQVFKLDPRFKQYQLNIRCCWAFSINFDTDIPREETV